jgi:uncharacterized protein (TIGR02246 family)
MFERYTEKARRVIFFARYEASQYGSPYIESEHFLLGLFREDKALADRWLHEHGSIETIRTEIESLINVRERISTSVEVPLTPECKRILNFAADEADRQNHRHIAPGHLLLGILREDECVAAKILRARGLDLGTLRLEFARIGAHEVNMLHRPGIEEAKIGQALEQLLEAWTAKDAKKFSSFFDEKGQFWDTSGEQWIGPANVEKGLAALFAGETSTWDGNIRDVKYVRADVAVITILWREEGASGTRYDGRLGMNLVMAETAGGWSINSAFLTQIVPA